MNEIKKPAMAVEIAGISFKNPVLTASGTFASGREYAEFIDVNRLGGITVKGVSYEPWSGNAPPRIAETYGGMLNAVGLQNPGVQVFISEDIPYLKQLDTNVVVNVCGHTIEEYVQVVNILNDQPVEMFELNISCPNVQEGGIAFGTDPKMVEKTVQAVKKASKKPLIVKLSPNVTDITEIARAAESGGADALSLINTLIGMKIDIYRKRTVLANGTGGLSGPAIRPVAVRMVYQVHKAVKIPLIGMGGILTGADAIEFIMAGATAIAVGTANFSNPYATIQIIDEIKSFMNSQSIGNIQQMTGVI